MYCGQGCPCCVGTYAGEFCNLKVAMLGYTKFPQLDECEVDGLAWNEDGSLTGDVCQFNIVKYLIKYNNWR